MPERGDWLLISATTAGAPASLRVTAWRKLKQLGALYLQQSVCLLPANAMTESAMDALRARMVRDGGQLRVVRMSVTDERTEQELIAELQAARDQEYAELLGRLPEFFTELEQEQQRGNTTYEEVEESEADLARFRSWLDKIAARDYFESPGNRQVRAELDRAERALEAFADLALARHEGCAAAQTTPTRAQDESTESEGSS